MTVSRRGFLKGLAALLVSAPLIKVPAQAPPALPLAPVPVRIAKQVEEEELTREIRSYEPYTAPPMELPNLPAELPKPLKLGQLIQVTMSPRQRAALHAFSPTTYETMDRGPQTVVLEWLLRPSPSLPLLEREDALGQFLQAYHAKEFVCFECSIGYRHFYIIGHVLSWSLDGNEWKSLLQTEITCEQVIEEEIL